VHALDFIAGRGAILLPSGKRVRASLMVLPVVWQAAAALVAREARAARVKLVLMSGVAPLSQLVVEGVAVRRAVASPDVLGLKPPAWRAPRPEATLTVDVARAAEAARIALAKEPSLHAAVRGVEVRHERRDNAYICNATAYDVTALGRRGASMLATSGTAGIAVRRTFVPANGFVHWPGTIASEAAGASAHILLAMVDALAC
jgi:hypothetical protein